MLASSSPDAQTSSVTVGGAIGKVKKYEAELYRHAQRAAAPANLGQFSSVRLNFLMYKLGNVCMLNKIVGIKQPECNGYVMSMILGKTNAHEIMAVRGTPGRC